VVGTEEPLLGAVFDVPPVSARAGAGQAQGSTGPETLETASRQRVRLEEQGLGAPASRASARGEKGREGKARGDARPRSAAVLFGGIQPGAASSGGKASEGSRHIGESGFVAGGNDVNPMVGSAMQHSRRVREAKTVAVVENHEGGTRGEMASRLRRLSSDARPGVDSRAWTAEGIFGNPKRGRPHREMGSIGLAKPGEPAPRSGGSGIGMRKCPGATPTAVLEGHPSLSTSGGQGHGGQRRGQRAATTSGFRVRKQRATSQRSVTRAGPSAKARARVPGRSLTMVSASSLWNHERSSPTLRVDPRKWSAVPLKTSEPHTRPGAPRGALETSPGSNL